MGTDCHENYTTSLGFSRVDERAPDTARPAVLYRVIIPFSRQSDSRDYRLLTKKRELFPEHAPTSPSSFALPH
jgi:hypothetical protein